MTIQQLLTTYQTQAKPHYQQFFQFWTQEFQKTGPVTSKLIEKFIDLYPRGKQFRGALSVLGYQLSGGNDLDQMYKASITLELLETSVLIEDDIFDKDEIRRGVPTIHKQWEQELTDLDPALQQEMARNMAIITVTNGYYLATHALSRTTLPPQRIQQALEFYSYSVVLTWIGEILDIYSVKTNSSQKKDSAQTIHQYKTIWYTAILPLSFGAILAGAGQKQLDSIKQIATIIGSIYQIQDDILGSFGDPKITGKTNNQDIQEGRWTILIELLSKELSIQTSIQEDEQIFTTLMSKPTRTPEDIQTIKQLLQKYDIVNKAKDIAKQQADKSQHLIPKITNNKDHQNTLKNILQFLLTRQK